MAFTLCVKALTLITNGRISYINAVVVPGSVEKGVVEVTNCFCVPHKESDYTVRKISRAFNSNPVEYIN